MLNLNGQTILLGGFHDHWARADADNPSLLLAALNFYHYDFLCLMDGGEADRRIQQIASRWCKQLRIYLGREECYGWGHLVTLGPKAPQLPQDNLDWVRVLQQTKANYDLLILAHPCYPTTWEKLFLPQKMDQLLDEGLIDGVQLTIGSDGRDAQRNAALVNWFEMRDRAGKLTPIVGGWDVHQALPVKNLPPVLYTAEHPPDGTFETACDNRTLVFAARNELTDICRAVREGQTVIEDLRTGRLVGPARLVRFLEDNGYRSAIRQMDADRDAVRLEQTAPCVAGQNARVRIVAPAGTINWPDNFDQITSIATAGGSAEITPRVPALLDRDLMYLPVTWQDDSGGQRFWAVQSIHPIQFDVLPHITSAQTDIEVVVRAPLHGTLQLELENNLGTFTQVISGSVKLPLAISKPSPTPVRYTAKITNDHAITRSLDGYLTFLPVHRFNGSWQDIGRIGVDESRFEAVHGYGHSRPWPGPDAFSAQIQFAWDEQTLYFSANVTDPIHYQPFDGHFTYNADCLQLAIDPLLRRNDSVGSFYSFNLALTKHGPELFRIHSPQNEAGAQFSPPANNVSLRDRFLKIIPTPHGLRYEMRLPWAELAPVQPAAGLRMGVYFIMFNNNGQGHLDTLHWPVPLEGMWMTPSRWGVLSLIA